MKILLQRVCWNVNLWRGPSGAVPPTEKSYASEHGFGHEEWNFNTNDLIDGFVHGYIYYNPKDVDRRPGQRYDIYFFAIAPTKERLLVGAYHDAQFLTTVERKKLKDQMERSGLLGWRAEEIAAVGGADFGESEAKAREILGRDFAWNLRVRPENVRIFRPARHLEKPDVGGRNIEYINRYHNPVFLDAAPSGERAGQRTFETQFRVTPPVLSTEAYIRKTAAQEHLIERRHNQLSQRLQQWLREIGAIDIIAEQQAVDLQFEHNGDRWLFEVKTCDGRQPRYAIRDAIGQVLEYTLFPGRESFTHAGIVTDLPPAPDEIEWLSRLRERGLEIELFWLAGELVYCAAIGDSILAGMSHSHSTGQRRER